MFKSATGQTVGEQQKACVHDFGESIVGRALFLTQRRAMSDLESGVTGDLAIGGVVAPKDNVWVEEVEAAIGHETRFRFDRENRRDLPRAARTKVKLQVSHDLVIQ